MLCVKICITFIICITVCHFCQGDSRCCRHLSMYVLHLHVHRKRITAVIITCFPTHIVAETQFLQRNSSNLIICRQVVTFKYVIIFTLPMSIININVKSHMYNFTRDTHDTGINLDFMFGHFSYMFLIIISILFISFFLLHCTKSDLYIQLFRNKISRLILILESYWIG